MKKIKKQLFVFPPGMVGSLLATALGALVPAIQNNFGLSKAGVGLISTMQNAGALGALILCFCLLSGLNKARVLLISYTFNAIGLIALGLTNNTYVLYTLFLMIGLFNMVSGTLANSLMAEGQQGKSSLLVSLLHGVWSLMAAFGSFYVLIFGGDFSKSFIWLGILMLGALAISTLGLIGDVRQPMLQDRSKMGSVKKLWSMCKYKGMAALMMIGFFTTVVRVAFTFFIKGYIQDLGGEGLVGAFVLGVLYLGMFAGRFLYGNLSHLISPNKIMFISNVLGLGMFTFMLFAENMTAITVLMAIGSICISINIPIIIAKAFEIVPGDTTGATSLIFSSVVLGGVAGPPLIGLLGDLFTTQLSLLLCVATLITVIVLSFRMMEQEKFLTSVNPVRH